MRRMTIIILFIEALNWFYVDWDLGWQILFSAFGLMLWLMVWAVKTSEPDPEQPKPPKYYESTFFNDN